MVAGEYAVLEPSQRAVVIAVDRYITAHIKPGRKNYLSVPKWGIKNITWDIMGDELCFSMFDPRLNFIQNSIYVANRYLQESSHKPSSFELIIDSELDDPLSGRKYGLGSSGAVTVAVISSILAFNRGERELDELEKVFKLAVIANFKTQGSGSGADLAASVYGGWLEYSAFNSEWLSKELIQHKSLGSIIEKAWPDLSIRRLIPPPLLHLAVGWTKEAALTAPMIKKVEDFKDNKAMAYSDFLLESSNAVTRLIRSFESQDHDDAINSLSQNRKALRKLGGKSGINIETEELRKLCSIAERFGSAKSSGAGGGDCGIAFLKSETDRIELLKAWAEENIKPLDISVSGVGVTITSRE